MRSKATAQTKGLKARQKTRASPVTHTNLTLPTILYSVYHPIINKIVLSNFSKTYSNRNIEKGQNLIVLKVITKYINSVLDYELQQTEKHQDDIQLIMSKLDIK